MDQESKVSKDTALHIVLAVAVVTLSIVAISWPELTILLA